MENGQQKRPDGGRGGGIFEAAARNLKSLDGARRMPQKNRHDGRREECRKKQPTGAWRWS